MTRFRVATYNVHKCRGLDKRTSVHRIAQVMCAVNPHIWALQEITRPQANELSQITSTILVFGAARQLGGEDYGNAVFSKFPILASDQFDLTVPNREPRQCLLSCIQLPEAQTLYLFAVHLGTSYFERRLQATRLLSAEVLSRPDLCGARIIAGDFNEWTRGAVTQQLSRHMRSADHARHLRRRRTYPALLPFLHLDHIYYDPQFQLEEMHLHKTRTSLMASDHLPLVADFLA